MTRGAVAVAAMVAALCILGTATSSIYDTDVWQHLLVGKVIWQTHSIPHTQLWTWPTHGAPDVLPSWLYRALLWPIWQAAGLPGLFVWRWLATLLAFGLAWVWRGAWARPASPIRDAGGARLPAPAHADAPEMFAGILLISAGETLEGRRRLAARPPLARDAAWGVVPIALLWANAHISYYLRFIISGAYLLDDLLRRRHGRAPGALALAIVVAGVASLVNPFGWDALLQPLQYFTTWHEAIYQSIGELSPIYWDVHVKDMLPVWFVLVIGGALAHWRARGFDAAQAVLLLVCVTQAITTQRFLGYAALTLAPFAARDTAELLGRLNWPRALRAPMARSALAAVACLGVVTPTLADATFGFGFGWKHRMYPERASGWIETHGVRGKAFNTFAEGGYLLYRFYPDPGGCRSWTSTRPARRRSATCTRGRFKLGRMARAGPATGSIGCCCRGLHRAAGARPSSTPTARGLVFVDDGPCCEAAPWRRVRFARAHIRLSLPARWPGRDRPAGRARHATRPRVPRSGPRSNAP
jgi:hypothetical protein